MITTVAPAEAFPAGDYLRDELEARGWTIKEFAEIVGRPVQAVSEILNGKKEITTETACAFAEALDTTPELWLNLQTNYRLFEARRSAGISLSLVARRARLRRLLPVAKARARGWLPDTDDLDRLEAATCELLSLTALDDPPSFAKDVRRSDDDEPITPEELAWFAHVRALGRALPTGPRFDPEALSALAGQLPQRTADGPTTLSLIPEWFAACGVVVVFADTLPGSEFDGISCFVDDVRPLVGLTTRGNRFDRLLLALLHATAHLTLGHVSPGGRSIIDLDVAAHHREPIEVAADRQALTWLFPNGLALESASAPAIARAAEALGIHPGVIAGHLERSGARKADRTRIPRVRRDLADAGLLR